MRIKGGIIETSKQIKIGIEEARRMWQMVSLLHRGGQFRHGLVEDATEVANLLVGSRAFKVNSKYLNRSYERLNVINEGVVPAVEGCVGYTNEEFERVNKENNDPESEKIGSFNKTVEEANNIRSRVLKYVDKIKQERAYNIDLCMTFERYIEIADKDAERAMAFLKEAYPFNEETEVFIRKRYNMSIDVNPEEN